MKQLKCPENVRNYNSLYQDSIVMSQHHEIQRYGKRSEYLTNAAKSMITKNNQATFVNSQQQV